MSQNQRMFVLLCFKFDWLYLSLGGSYTHTHEAQAEEWQHSYTHQSPKNVDVVLIHLKARKLKKQFYLLLSIVHLGLRVSDCHTYLI